MIHRKWTCAIVFFTICFFWRPGSPVQAQSSSPIEILENSSTSSFPSGITFSGKFRSGSAIQKIVLEYGSNSLTCTNVTAKAFPSFNDSPETAVEWTWNMERADSVPPGGKIHWQWRITNADGDETLTDLQEVLWLDREHAWQNAKGNSVTVHFYGGGTGFGNRMLGAAEAGLKGIQNLTSLQPDGPIDLYLYPSYADLRKSVYNEPQWTGGLAYGEFNLLLLGIPSGSEDWGEKAIAHELMHVVVGRFGFSCLGHRPAWLDEGLAMVSEGDLDLSAMVSLKAAILSNQIFPVKSLGGGFPEDPGKADLAYSESWSIVHFLFQKGGGASIRNLLAQLRDGISVDDALRSIYGFDVDGLDAAWRADVGAPKPKGNPQPSLRTATAVPTFEPARWDSDSNSPTDEPPAQTQTATPAAEPPTVEPTDSSSSWASLSLLAVCMALCCGLILFFFALLWFFSRRKSA
jgi:hypothetical protein